ncbi:MAG: Dabb family protein [Acidimicrobiaceae bacterium]
MFHHVVLLTWTDQVPAGHPAVAQSELQAYAQTLSGLVSYHCGPNAGLTAGAADFAVTAVFENEAAWHAYDTADEHNRIRRDVFGPYVAERKVIQFVS